MAKRCVQCNSINDDNQIYCYKCRSFLLAGSSISKEPSHKSIWEIQSDAGNTAGNSGYPAPGNAGRSAGSPSPARPAANLVRKCPMCGYQEAVINGQLPLFCTACNYFFQDEDRPVAQKPKVSTGARNPGAVQKSVPSEVPVTPMQPRRSGPMRRAQNDHSSLRLICLSEKGSMILSVKQEGAILGTAGTLHSEAFRIGGFRGICPKHVSIWHTEAGWYLRALAGFTLLNGGALNVGASVPLANGDDLTIGDCSLRVEVMRE